ncbi:MAG: hypothetical protein AAB850_01355, partial [Patescibacteria group bacterium]
YEQEKNNITATTISSEFVLSQHDSAFAEEFEQVKKSLAYQTRLAAEAHGIEAIKSGTYKPASIEDKRERPV